MSGLNNEVIVQMSNPSDALAFFVELRIVDSDGNSILPVLWDDNYVSILPGESRKLTARTPTAEVGTGASLVIDGWNVEQMTVGLAGR
jgi:exo-1,4-beta-D-glucosaminidase